jgi:hypothetical protein
MAFHPRVRPKEGGTSITYNATDGGLEERFGGTIFMKWQRCPSQSTPKLPRSKDLATLLQATIHFQPCITSLADQRKALKILTSLL